MSAIKITPHDDLRASLTPNQRNCYFPDEYKLTLHKNYSQVFNIQCFSDKTKNKSFLRVKNDLFLAMAQ